MGAIKKYFKKEFQKEMFALDHDKLADFYLSCWQKNRSPLPLLFLRTFIFAGCVSILIASMIITFRVYTAGTWFIFLTHWGLIFNTLASGLALYLSMAVCCRRPVVIDASLELPWYVQAYWVFYNISVPLAFFISIFYWLMLTELGDDYGIDPVLDVFIHGVNSLLMLTLVLVGRHPTRLLHFYWVVFVGLIYMIFTIIFHVIGATSPFGETWIYPMVDWSTPGPTIGVMIGSAVGLIVMQCLTAAIGLGRDKLTKRFRETNVISISNDRYN